MERAAPNAFGGQENVPAPAGTAAPPVVSKPTAPIPKSELYRDHARRIRVLAHRQPEPAHRELMELAEQYERLADQADFIERIKTR